MRCGGIMECYSIDVKKRLLFGELSSWLLPEFLHRRGVSQQLARP